MTKPLKVAFYTFVITAISLLGYTVYLFINKDTFYYIMDVEAYALFCISFACAFIIMAILTRLKIRKM